MHRRAFGFRSLVFGGDVFGVRDGDAQVVRRATLDELQLKSDGERHVRRDLATVAAARRQKALTERPSVRFGPGDPRLKTGLRLHDADGHALVGVGDEKGRDRAGSSPFGAARPPRYTRPARRPGIPAAPACRSRRSPRTAPPQPPWRPGPRRKPAAGTSNPERTRISRPPRRRVRCAPPRRPHIFRPKRPRPEPMVFDDVSSLERACRRRRRRAVRCVLSGIRLGRRRGRRRRG